MNNKFWDNLIIACQQNAENPFLFKARNAKIDTNPFAELYKNQWLKVIETEPICSVKSRTAQAILRSNAVDYIRHKELKQNELKYFYKLQVLMP